VPSAWAVTHTTYSTATHSEPGTALTRPLQKEPKENSAYAATVPPSGSNGREPGMSQHQAQHQAHLLWVQSDISRSSTVPSFAESLKRSLLTFQKHGTCLLEKLTYTINTLTLYLAFVKVSSSISLQSLPPKHLPINNLSLNLPKSSPGLLSTRSPSNARLDQSRTKILRCSLALSNLRPSPSFRNQEKPTNIVMSRIILSQCHPPPFSQTHLSTPSSTPTHFP